MSLGLWEGEKLAEFRFPGGRDKEVLWMPVFIWFSTK